jgi:hypothetical protein
MPLSNAAAANGPGGTTSGEPEPEEERRDMVMLSVMALPQVGHIAWSVAWEVGGADVELCMRDEKNLEEEEEEELIPSREIVIGGDGV